MNLTIATVAKIMNVNGKTIKDWSYHFAEYLSAKANPPKGRKRFYVLDDIRVFAYVALYWEEHPDIESIKWGLNSENHFEIKLIDNLIQETTPIFSEEQDDVNFESSVIFGGMSPLGDALTLANAFKESGDMLIASFQGDIDIYKYISPILYQYRHAVELYLKSVIAKEEKIHDLQKLYSRFKQKIKDEFSEDIPSWFENIILAFDKVDKGGSVFRYGGDIAGDEIIVDLNHIKSMMNRFAQSINAISKNKNI